MVGRRNKRTCLYAAYPPCRTAPPAYHSCEAEGVRLVVGGQEYEAIMRILDAAHVSVRAASMHRYARTTNLSWYV